MVDWTAHDGLPESTCYCRCDAVYRTHAKAVRNGGSLKIVARRPCPGCERTDGIWQIRDDPETMVL